MRNGQRVYWACDASDTVWQYVGKLPKPTPNWPRVDQHVIYENAVGENGVPTYGAMKIVNGCHLSAEPVDVSDIMEAIFPGGKVR